jgi:hypothetical protein
VVTVQGVFGPVRDAVGHVKVISAHPQSTFAIHLKINPGTLAITRSKSQLSTQSSYTKFLLLYGRRELVKVRSIGFVASSVTLQAIRGKKRACEESRGSSSSLSPVPVELPKAKKRMCTVKPWTPAHETIDSQKSGDKEMSRVR